MKKNMKPLRWVILKMLEYADISVAMGNGVKEVKEKADYVTDKIDNDGLYKAFKYLKLF